MSSRSKASPYPPQHSDLEVSLQVPLAFAATMALGLLLTLALLPKSVGATGDSHRASRDNTTEEDRWPSEGEDAGPENTTGSWHQPSLWHSWWDDSWQANQSSYTWQWQQQAQQGHAWGHQSQPRQDGSWAEPANTPNAATAHQLNNHYTPWEQQHYNRPAWLDTWAEPADTYNSEEAHEQSSQQGWQQPNSLADSYNHHIITGEPGAPRTHDVGRMGVAPPTTRRKPHTRSQTQTLVEPAKTPGHGGARHP